MSGDGALNEESQTPGTSAATARAERAAAVDAALTDPGIIELIEEALLDREAIAQQALSEMRRSSTRAETTLFGSMDGWAASRRGARATRVVLWVERGALRVGPALALGVLVLLVADALGVISIAALTVLAFTMTVIAGLALIAWRAEALRRAEKQTKASREALSQAQDVLRARLRKDAKQAVREIVNRALERRFSRTLQATDAGGLRDMLASDYDVPTAAARRLERLLSALNAGAIGVAGPRGAGKSTVIRAACHGRLGASGDKPSGPAAAGVIVSAPVRYEARDFIVYLLARVCLHVLGHVEDEERLLRAERARRRLLLQVLAVSAVVLAVAAALFQWLVIDNASVGGSAVGLAVAAAALALFSAAPSGSELALRIWPPPPRPAPTLEIEAREMLQRLHFLETTTREAGGELGGRTLVKATTKAGRSLAAQALTLPELIDKYERFVRLVAEDAPLIIGIDELDKMASVEDAERFLNDVKTLFATGQVYYLVSISDDAMSAFERRGLPLRDVFESTFDDVLRVEALTVDESERLLQRRIVPIGPPFPDLCHVLAGGLPRELIRAARQMMAAAEAGGDLAMVTATVIAERDLARVRAAEALARTHVARDGNQPLLAWLRTLPGATDPDRLLKRCDVGPIARELSAASAPEDPPRELELLLCELAAQWYHSATVWEFFVPLDEPEWRAARTSADSGVLIDVLAQAQLDLAASPRLAWETVSSFRGNVGLRVLDYPV